MKTEGVIVMFSVGETIRTKLAEYPFLNKLIFDPHRAKYYGESLE